MRKGHGGQECSSSCRVPAVGASSSLVPGPFLSKKSNRRSQKYPQHLEHSLAPTPPTLVYFMSFWNTSALPLTYLNTRYRVVICPAL